MEVYSKLLVGTLGNYGSQTEWTVHVYFLGVLPVAEVAAVSLRTTAHSDS